VVSHVQIWGAGRATARSTRPAFHFAVLRTHLLRCDVRGQAFDFITRVRASLTEANDRRPDPAPPYWTAIRFMGGLRMCFVFSCPILGVVSREEDGYPDPKSLRRQLLGGCDGRTMHSYCHR